MAAVQVKKTQIQAEQTIFALDIGTRSIIGMVGTVENEKIRIIAIEREEHTERAMIDGQIENIDKVAAVAGKVKQKLESKLHFKLERVCVAAAGRALRTKRAEFEMEVSGKDLIDDEVISRLEAGAISKAEEAFDAENRSMEDNRRFYLVGYTVCQYYLDKYMISSLKDHRGKSVKVDLIATFLPSEVVESLYTTMNKIGLEVASITLEPIAAINAAIPANLRLLNLVLVDIGAGTSDIAACTDGSVTGYTMATMAGDEITETLMKEYLVDFQMAESMKAQADQEEEITFTDILGFEQTISRDELLACIQDTSDHLCREIADKILEINGNPPSALFLAGGGSKLTGLKEGLTAALQMDSKRVAIAGNNFRTSAFSDEYDLNNPEYATPLGIAVSSGLNLINASFRVILNGRPANLFRSGSFTALNLLMMNGYSFLDVMGHSGANLVVTVNGRRKVFYGTPVEPAALFINKKEGRLSEIIQAGDEIDFTPAVSGVSAAACLGDINGAAEAVELTLNGMPADLETQLKMGDVIVMRRPGEEALTEEAAEAEEGAAAEDVPAAEEGAEPEPAAVPEQTQEQEPVQQEESAAAPDRTAETAAEFSEPAGTERQPETAEETAEETEPVEMKQEEEPKPALNPQRNFAQRSALEAAAPVSQREEKTAVSAQPPEVHFHLNGMPITLPRKTDGTSYFLMDMIQYSGIDLKQPKGRIVLTVNGMQGLFQQELRDGDNIRIEEEM
ncbi:MAG: cell division protein FtsA [Lachnospiraceae bacterium]|uniref:cell division FtsA domain-containing protein n=1 Tax=Candidatus Merdisoma sp. JLR.KK011 TaxID=3114299 RepID=UPI002FF16035|nr:cell division protein FtsA [Lachnospiraceae bacterium]